MKKNKNKNILIKKNNFAKFKNSWKGIIKELKRVHWPNEKEAKKVFGKALIFIIIGSIFLFLITIFFVQLWQWLGVGI